MQSQAEAFTVGFLTGLLFLGWIACVWYAVDSFTKGNAGFGILFFLLAVWAVFLIVESPMWGYF